MGQRNHDREVREARARYLGALNRARAAGRAELLQQIPIDPGPDPQRPVEWAEEHWQTLLDVTAALRELAAARRDWDGLRRDWQAPH